MWLYEYSIPVPEKPPRSALPFASFDTLLVDAMHTVLGECPEPGTRSSTLHRTSCFTALLFCARRTPSKRHTRISATSGARLRLLSVRAPTPNRGTSVCTNLVFSAHDALLVALLRSGVWLLSDKLRAAAPPPSSPDCAQQLRVPRMAGAPAPRATLAACLARPAWVPCPHWQPSASRGCAGRLAPRPVHSVQLPAFWTAHSLHFSADLLRFWSSEC